MQNPFPSSWLCSGNAEQALHFLNVIVCSSACLIDSINSLATYIPAFLLHKDIQKVNVLLMNIDDQ